MMACPGADSDAPQEWTANSAPDKVAGLVVCGIYQGNADIMWSHDSNLMLADVQSADLEGLYKWWTDYS